MLRRHHRFLSAPVRLLTILVCGALVCGPVAAQLIPNLPAVEGITDRQAERAQERAAERAQQQAEQAQERVAERTQASQVESVQGQVVDRVESQVERAQSQASERAQDQVERVQSQVERAGSQVERVQNQTAEQTGRRLEGLPEQANERARDAVNSVESTAVNGADKDVGNNVANGVANGINRAAPVGVPPQTPAPDTRGVAAATADEVVVTLPGAGTRQNVLTQNGAPAFVEITVEPGVQAVEFEWVMLVTPAQRQQLDNQADQLMGFLTDSEDFGLTGGQMLTFSVPPDLDANDAILDLVPTDLRDLIDRNHVYQVQTTDAAETEEKSTLLPLPMPAVCTEPVTVGVIDSAIDTHHAAFADVAKSRIQTRSFVDDKLVQPAAHGTAVAAVLVGQHEDNNIDAALQPLLPAATLYNAAVFHANEAAQQGATVMRILNAINWLVSEPDVHVINMSLAGPPNKLLAQAVLAASQQGKLIVAAVGNEGAHGPVRYPAAYDEVIGVTAVERSTGIYRWSNQGPQIDYAALGVAVPTARGDGSFGPESGTSIAAPVIAAFLACAMAQNQGDVSRAIAAVDAHLRDLGEPGKDPVFGKGLLHP